MEIKTKFFGAVAVDPAKIVDFPQGIPGFEQLRRFIWLQPENSIFSSLQALDREETAFITISPFLVCPDYSFELDDQIARELGLTKLEEALILGMITIPPQNPGKSTVNLKAPVIINHFNQRGLQIILDGNYPLRAPLGNGAGITQDKISK
jgi:flagellar assembly factor FliW